MSLQHMNDVATLGFFGEACTGGTLDWRRRCKDEILFRIPLVLVDQHIDDLPYRALIKDTSQINFRQAWEQEGGTENPNCCPSTASTDVEVCDFKMPGLQMMSVGVEPRCYWDWEKEFCKEFPRHKGCSPFRRNGQNIELILENEQGTRTAFLTYIKSELAQAWWTHIYTTAWAGRDSYVDQHNGIFYYLENGIEARDTTEGGCDYPLKPVKINLALYIHGAAAVAEGACAAPGDVVLAVDDPLRPVDAPADNFYDIYPGKSCGTTWDLTGKDTIDILVDWMEFITNEWGVNVLDWLLGTPRNQFKCLAQVAACKQACAGSDCRHLLTADDRDTARADREAEMIRSRVLRLFPYEDVALPIRQSEALRQTNTLLFLPERFSDDSGAEQWWMLWAWRNRQQMHNNLFNNIPQLRSTFGLQPSRLLEDFDGTLYDGDEFNIQAGRLLDAVAFDWLADWECNSLRWWNNAEAMMIPQCPHLWLCLEGICCDKVLTLPCCGWQTDNPTLYYNVDDSCSDIAAPATYISAIELDIIDVAASGFSVGDAVDYRSAHGTSHQGVILAYTGANPNSTVQIGFPEALHSVAVDCTSDGGANGGNVSLKVNP